MPTEHSEATLKYAMEHATSSLPPLPDLVPAAVVGGRRRRRRARVIAAVGAACLAALVSVSVPAVWPEASAPDKTGPADAPTWLPPLTELTPAAKNYSVRTTLGKAPEGSQTIPGSADLPAELTFSPAEQELRRTYQNRVAAALERLLAIPAATYEIDEFLVGTYDVVLPDGTRYPLSIDAVARPHSLLEPQPLRCDAPRMHESDRASCMEHPLPNGAMARTYQSVSPMASTPAGDIRYGKADVTITMGQLYPVPPRLTDAQMYAVLTDPELLQLNEFLVTHKLYEGAKAKGERE